MTKEQNKGQSKIQVGKKGLTDGLLTAIDNAFNTRKVVKVNLLKSATRDKREVEEMAEKIVDYLRDSRDENYSFETRGFTITISKDQ